MSTLVALPALWFLAGQPLSNLGGWLGGYGQIITGYASAMGASTPTLAWQYPVALLLVGTLVTAITCTVGASAPTRSVIAAIVLLGLYVAFRTAFTRQSGTEFFIPLIVIPLVFTDRWPTSRWLILTLAAGLALVATMNVSLHQLTDIPAYLHNASRTVKLVLSSSERTRWVNSEASTLGSGYSLPPEIVKQVGSQTVDVIPADLAVLFVYPSMRWRPLPVFQDYAAYTKNLDDRNSNVLAGSERPRDIIRATPAAIDGRLQRFEPPRENLELVCRYGLAVESPRSATSSVPR